MAELTCLGFFTFFSTLILCFVVASKGKQSEVWFMVCTFVVYTAAVDAGIIYLDFPEKIGFVLL